MWHASPLGSKAAAGGALTTTPRIGHEIAGYRLESLIERGGMAVVYVAEHVRMGRKVALKILAPELSDDDRFRERFLHESRLAASINHPNIIPMYDAGEADDLLYIAMRYVEGTDLRSLLTNEGPLDVERALTIVAQVGSALDAAHLLGLVHRDVKPANILIVPRISPEAPDHVYLTDFGLSKHQESLSGLTQTGQFVGTIDYIAPEQIEGREVDGRADLYALACVLFETLTGKIPFSKNNEVAVLWAHLQESPPPLTDFRPDLPAASDAVMAKALAKSPEDRYATAAEFVAAARRALRQPAEAPATPAPPRDGDEAPPVADLVLVPDPSASRPPAAASTGLAPGSPDEGSAIPGTIQGAPSRGKRLPVLALVAAFLVGAAAASGVFLLTDVGKREVIAAPTRDTGDLDVSALLLDHIPEAIRPTCSQGTNHDPGAFLVTLSCSAENGIEVQYNLSHSGTTMNAHYREDLSDHGIEAGGGNCAFVAQGEGEWWRVGSQGHTTLDPGQGPGPQGHVFCYEEQGESVIMWIDRPLKIFASARIAPADRATLFQWWADQAGPANPEVLNHAGSSSGMDMGGAMGEPSPSSMPSG